MCPELQDGSSSGFRDVRSAVVSICSSTRTAVVDAIAAVGQTKSEAYDMAKILILMMSRGR